MSLVEDNVNKSILNKMIDIISGIFIPIINVMMAAALLKGILMVAYDAGFVTDTDGVYRILYAISDGFFYFLPMFLAYTAAHKLKANPYTAVLIAAALIYPDITDLFESGGSMDLFGIPIPSVTYPSSVIPIILAVGLLHYVEIPLNNYLPKALKGFLQPMLSVMIVTPITFLVFGPIGTMIGQVLADAFGALYGFNPIMAGAILGMIWQPMVIFGFQWGMVPVIIDHINNLGMDTVLPLLGPAVMGQAGASMAVSIMTKNKKLKSLAMSCSVTAILGITEPALYGVNVPLKRPMIAACLAGAIGGAIVGTSNASAVSFAFPSMISLVVYLGEGFWTFFIALIVGFVVGFILTLLFRFVDPVEKEEVTETKVI